MVKMRRKTAKNKTIISIKMGFYWNIKRSSYYRCENWSKPNMEIVAGMPAEPDEPK
jgi:hypothetical protein